MALLLVGCASNSSNEDDRRFANDPVTAQPTEFESVVPTLTPNPTALAPQDQPTLGDLLTATDSPSTAFVLVGGRVVAVSPESGNGALVLAVPNPPVAIDQSPDGTEVAILSWSGSSFRVDLMNADGQTVRSWSDVADLGTPSARAVGSPPSASPEAGATAAYPGSISFAPDGTSLLVTTGAQQVVAIDLDGGIERFDLPSDIAGIESARWSREGDVVAVLARDADGVGLLWTFAPNVDGSGLRLLVPDEEDATAGSVQAFDWLPSADGLLILMADKGDSTQPGGQLYTVGLNGDHRQLVGSAGRIGPAARIVDFAVSPDGRSIAYAIVIPNGQAWEFDSLWVRSLDQSTTYEIPTGSVAAIPAISWVQGGVILVRESPRGADVLFVPASGNPVVYGLNAIPGTPGATPMEATPQVASPVADDRAANPVPATPAASPADATPVATPATPAASPSSTPVRG